MGYCPAHCEMGSPVRAFDWASSTSRILCVSCGCNVASRFSILQSIYRMVQISHSRGSAHLQIYTLLSSTSGTTSSYMFEIYPYAIWTIHFLKKQLYIYIYVNQYCSIQIIRFLQCWILSGFGKYLSLGVWGLLAVLMNTARAELRFKRFRIKKKQLCENVVFNFSWGSHGISF